MDKDWEDLSDDLHELPDWATEFHARFGGEKFFPYQDPSRIRMFIDKQIKQAKLQAYQECLEAVGEDWAESPDKHLEYFKYYNKEKHNIRSAIKQLMEEAG